MNDQQRELLADYMHGHLPQAREAELNELLRHDADAREWLRSEAALEVALRELAITGCSRAVSPAPASTTHTLRWRPLWAAAAAGVMFGVFSASFVFGFVARQHTTVETLLTEGFESSGLLLERGVPTRVGVWSGNVRAWKSTDGDVEPVEGKRIVTLPLVEKSKFSYAFRLVDLGGVPTADAGSHRQLEVTARFHGANLNAHNRFQIRLAVFAEDAARASDIWVKDLLDDMALDHMAKTEHATNGWKTVRATIDVPKYARIALVSLGAANGVDEPKSHHFLDDVQIRLITREDDALP